MYDGGEGSESSDDKDRGGPLVDDEMTQTHRFRLSTHPPPHLWVEEAAWQKVPLISQKKVQQATE